MVFRSFSPPVWRSEADEAAPWAGMQAGEGRNGWRGAELEPAAGCCPARALPEHRGTGWAPCRQSKLHPGWESQLRNSLVLSQH